MISTLDILEKLVENKLEDAKKVRFYTLLSYTRGDYSFGSNCEVKYLDHNENSIRLIVLYRHTNFIQEIKKNTPEHAKLILLFDKIRKYIAERDKQDLLNYVNL